MAVGAIWLLEAIIEYLIPKKKERAWNDFGLVVVF